MNAQVIYDVFCHEQNRLEAATQDYEMAKWHFRNVLNYRDSTNPEHERQFQEALERQNAARERYLEALADRQ